MSNLASSRCILRCSDTLLSVGKCFGVSILAPHCSSVRLFSKACYQSGPLSLASLDGEVELIHGVEKSKLKQRVSLTVAPRRREVKAIVKDRVDTLGLAPFAAKSFSELNLPPLLVERLEFEGFKIPTDVQAAAIPVILKDHDVVIQSYTGSGKTLAYLLPILSKIGPFKENNDSSSKTDIQAVVVAPSRELGMQIVREVEKLLGPAHKRLVQQLVGGANKSRQEDALKKNKPIIVVGTPGRIAEINRAGKLHTHGSQFLVLDEVDELLAFNFREDMHRILEHVGRRTSAGSMVNEAQSNRAQRHMIMVSATVPFSVIRAARSWGCDPLLVQANSITPVESIRVPSPVKQSETSSTSDAAANMETQNSIQSLPPSITHYYTLTRIQHKVDTLRRCMHALDAKCVIAFMNHNKRLKDAVFKLEARGMKSSELHGDLSKLARSTILKKLRNGDIRVLVTNELSARGLDIPECDLVVNLELPTDSTHYAHRAGRCGRLGRKGTVVTICEESEVFVVKKMQKRLGIDVQCCEFVEGKLVVKDEENATLTT